MREVENSISESTILVVDDNVHNALFLNKMLTVSGYKARSVHSGERALIECETNPPDLILLDINMPGLDGFEVCTKLKSHQTTVNIPVIFISGLSDTKEKIEAFKCGGVDYLTKPFHNDELLSRVKTHLEIKHNRQTISMYADQLQNTINDMSALFETGTLVASVVHDTKKFTTAMSMMLDAMIIPKLKEKLDSTEPWVEELLGDILEVHSNATQCTEFLESLLSINRKNEEAQPIDILKIIRQALNLVSYNLMQDGIQCEVNCDCEDRLMVTGNGQLVRVFMNLLVNAMDVLKKHTIFDPKITIKIIELEKRVQVLVIDNGPGIAKDVLEGIRKGMIVSTKGKDGNGFGVSGLTKIVKNLNGTIEIESEIGNGAVFIVSLQKSS